MSNIFCSDTQPIIAQTTPSGAGAVALLRLSGSSSIELATQMSSLASKELLSAQSSHTIHYGTVYDDTGSVIDHVLFFVMRAPRSFTGQDTVEISCHNNPFIIEAIIERALQLGARLACGGEFTRRAVLNNKMDLLQAEAIQELINANSQYALKTSLAQLHGSFSHTINQIEKELLKALALSESSFEFLDEESLEFSEAIFTNVTHLMQVIKELQRYHSKHQHIRQGCKIAIIGTVNAGKSSLFNALIGSQRAIVSPQAGTTRDSIESGLYSKGIYLTLVDTAGIRDTINTIEKEGIARAQQQADEADIIILVIDQSRIPSPSEQDLYQALIHRHGSKIISVLTKADLPKVTSDALSSPDTLSVSSTTKAGIETLRQALETKIEALYASANTPFLVNIRHHNLLIELEKELLLLSYLLQQQVVPFELISLHLKNGLAQISQLTGKTINEAAMDTIFKEFCVGK